MFETDKRVARIDGISGKYNVNNVQNSSVRYGRNSVQNFYSYLEKPLINDNNAMPPILDFSTNPEAADKNIEKMEKYLKENDAYLNALPPLEYEYRYMPNIHKTGDVNTDALLGAAYEELGRRKEVSVDELDKSFAINENFSTKPMDINNDGKIDIAEYGASILASDVLSNGTIKGTVNNNGHNAVQELMKKANSQAATELYSSLYNQYQLGQVVKKFNPES